MKRLSLVLAILKKDLLDSVKSKTVLLAIIFPVLLSLVFRLALSPQQMTRMKLGVVDYNESKLVSFIERSTLGNIEVTKLDDLEEAKEQVRNGTLHGVLVLPRDFDTKVKEGKKPWIDLWVDASNLSGGTALEMVLEKILYHYNNQSPPAELMIRNASGSGFQVKSALIPTWLLFTILGAYMIVASSILEERERKTLQAVLVTPAGITEVLIGKGLTGYFLTLAGSLLILALNQGFVGNIPGVLVIILTGTAFFTVLGVLIGLVLPGQTSTNTFGSILYMLFFLPVVLGAASKTMNLIAHFLPSYYVLNGINRTLFLNQGISSLIPHMLYLVLGSVILFVINGAILRRKENL